LNYPLNSCQLVLAIPVTNLEKGATVAKKLYVGNLSYDTSEDQVKELIGKSGTVESVSLITDKYSGRSKGFAFVEMATEEEASKAIAEVNGTELDGRNIVVNEAKPPKPRSNFNRGGGGFKRNNRSGYGGGRGRY
jgi:RNA recognition motif-containing protein